MTKKLYLIVLFFLICNGFQVAPIGILQNIGRGLPILIIELLWLIYGVKRFQNSNSANIKSRFVLGLYISIIPSILMAYILFGQSIVQSIISYRNLLLFFAIPALIKISPSIKCIVDAIFKFSIISLLFSCLQTSGMEFLFHYSEDMREYISMFGTPAREGELFVAGIAGYPIFTIPLYYYCQKIINKFSILYFSKALFIFILLIIVQNRSCLFPATIFFGFSLLKSNIRPRFYKNLFLILVGIVAINLVKDSFINLIDQTDRQITSTYDPRIIALSYFLDFDRMSISEILFGTGKISFNTSSFVKNLQESHIHYSDVGFIGFWSQFGIAPIIIFLVYLIRGLISIKIPVFIKFISAHILICSVTISYFDNPICIIWFALYYYLYIYYNKGIENRSNSYVKDGFREKDNSNKALSLYKKTMSLTPISHPRLQNYKSL